MSRQIREVVEAYERKFNPENTSSGRRAAHKEIGTKIRSLMEEKKLDVNRISFKHLWEKIVVDADLEENLTSSAFPTIAGEVISSVMIEGYKQWPDETAKLVKTVPSRLKTSQIVGWTAIGKIRKVNEREPYSQVTPPDEKNQTIKNFKYGGIIDLTKETIFFDQTGELIDRARELAGEGQRFKQEIIFKKLIDNDSDALSGSALYSAGNANLNTSRALDTAGWEATHQDMLAKTDDNTGKPIWNMMDRPVLMTATGLWAQGNKLLKNEYSAIGTANLDVNLARNMFDHVLNPYMTSSSTDWYYGSPKRQFRWEEVWPFETFTRTGQDTTEGFQQDIIQQFKCSLFGGCGAVDFKSFDKNTA